MAIPKTKDAVNHLVNEAKKLLNHEAAICLENFKYLFTISYGNLGKRFPTRILSGLTWIVPDKVSAAHDQILEVVEQYFVAIEGLDFKNDRDTVLKKRAEAKNQLDALKMK